MAADQAILREYLVALGFRIDQSGSRKVDNFLTMTDKKALGLGKSLVGLATTVVATTTIWARQMERMYYSARYADTTVEKLQELEYGTRNIGLEAGKGANALKNMTASIRSNPGLIGFLNSLGVKVEGRDKADVLTDLVAALKKFPFYTAQRMAGLFGIDPETLFNLEQGLDKMKEAQAQRAKMAEDMGYDADQAAASAHEYMTMWREVTERAGMFGSILGTAVLPYVKELVSETDQLLIKWSHIVKDMQEHGADDFWQKMREGLTGKAEGGTRATLTKEQKARLGLSEEGQTNLDGKKGVGIPRLMQKWERWRDERSGRNRYTPRVATDIDAVDAVGDMSDFRSKSGGGDDVGDTSDGGTDEQGFDPKQYLAALERRYHLPPGLLDRVWARESNRGDPKYMRSKKGALGHFGFMPDTAKEYGLKDPNDFVESGDAAARKWSDLLKRYHGNVQLAAAAYNYGDGKLAGVGYNLARTPDETQKYVGAVTGQPIQVTANPEIHIYGVSDPQKAADLVASKQREVNGDIVRNFSPKVR